jgi:hypothetical protein
MTAASAFSAMRRAGLEELGEVAAAAQLGDLELDAAGARLPDPLAVAVAAVQPRGGRLLVVAGAAAALDVDLHEALGHELHHLAQHIDVGALLGELIVQPLFCNFVHSRS